MLWLSEVKFMCKSRQTDIKRFVYRSLANNLAIHAASTLVCFGFEFTHIIFGASPRNSPAASHIPGSVVSHADWLLKAILSIIRFSSTGSYPFGVFVAVYHGDSWNKLWLYRDNSSLLSVVYSKCTKQNSQIPKIFALQALQGLQIILMQCREEYLHMKETRNSSPTASWKRIYVAAVSLSSSQLSIIQRGISAPSRFGPCFESITKETSMSLVSIRFVIPRREPCTLVSETSQSCQSCCTELFLLINVSTAVSCSIFLMYKTTTESITSFVNQSSKITNMEFHSTWIASLNYQAIHFSQSEMSLLVLWLNFCVVRFICFLWFPVIFWLRRLWFTGPLILVRNVFFLCLGLCFTISAYVLITSGLDYDATPSQRASYQRMY